jgi:uncharacterized membrane protein YhhN
MIFSVLFILTKSSKQNEPIFDYNFFDKLIPFDKFIKIVPTGSAMLFVILSQNDSFYLSTTLSIALFFCLLGDLGMEKGVIQGLPLFLIAQFFFIISFFGQAIEVSINFESVLISVVVAVLLALYLYFFVKYLNSSEKGLGKLLIPVIVYCMFISGMVLSVILLWVNSGRLELSIIVFGAILFVISDSIIAVKEFHHEITNNVVKVMTTYYLAIFLLSLSCLMSSRMEFQFPNFSS